MSLITVQQLQVMQARIAQEFGEEDSSKCGYLDNFYTYIGSIGNSDSEEILDLFCAACNKIFKSEKA